MNSFFRDRGIALLTVLLVLAIAALMANEMVLSGISASQHAVVRQNVRQAYYYALGGEAYARELLWQDHGEDQRAGREQDGVHDLWRDGRGQFELDEGQLTIQVSDLQGRFNLANLLSPDTGQPDPLALQQLEVLLDNLGFPAQLYPRIIDWVDTDQSVGPGGAEDQYYLRGAAPALAGNTVPADLSELQRVAQFKPAQFATLQLHLTSLPQATKLNVNSATVEVLKALWNGPVSTRPPQNARSELAAAMQDRGLAQSESLQAYLGTGSHWYEIEVLAEYRERSVGLRSIVQRDESSGVTRVWLRAPSAVRPVDPD